MEPQALLCISDSDPNLSFILFILLSRSLSVLQIEKLRLKDFKELAMSFCYKKLHGTTERVQCSL